MKAAVIGHPVAHSKSPRIHQYWLEKYGIKGSYEAIDIAPENLESGIERLAAQGYNGFNVTLPHKEAMLELCDELDDSAREIGAVNTVKIENERFYGSNTDAFGFIENLKQTQRDFNFKDANVFILGAGGAARAAIYGLKQAGVSNITLCNRTEERAAELAAEFDCGVAEWKDRSRLEGFSLLVNTTSLGMSGKEALEIDIGALSLDATVYDIVYAPLLTDLLIAAQDQGNKIVTGIGMLLHQARPAFKLWTGIMPEVTSELEKLVLS